MRTSITDGLTMEQRPDSIILEARYPWSSADYMIGMRTEHLEVPLGDLPALVMALVRTLQESGSDDVRGIGNFLFAHAR